MNAEPSAYARARILESTRARSLITKITEDFRQKTETKQKEACLATFTSSCIPVRV